MKPSIRLRPLQADDFSGLMKLWRSAESIVIRESDTEEGYLRFLRRNPESSFAACVGSELIGSVLAGHDGWRGYLYHMAVNPDFCQRGIGSRLVNAAVSQLREVGMERIHCLVKTDNLTARQFWEACGFRQREELLDYSI